MERVKPTRDENKIKTVTPIPLDYTPIYDVRDEQSLFSKIKVIQEKSQKRGAENAPV